MNVIFTVIFIFSVTVLLIVNPEGGLKAMTDGAGKAVTLSIGLLSVYSVWAGLLKVAEDSGITDGISRLVTPLTKKLFPYADDKTRRFINLNISANIFGLGGIATPLGIKATTVMSEKGDFDGVCMLFILAATSLQIIPTTVISLRQSYGSVSPSDIFLPSLLATVLSTGIGITLCKLTEKRKKK